MRSLFGLRRQPCHQRQAFVMVEVGHPARPHMIDQPHRMEAELLASMRPFFELMPRLPGLRREQIELNFLTHWKLTPVRDWRSEPEASVSHVGPRRVNCGLVRRREIVDRIIPMKIRRRITLDGLAVLLLLVATVASAADFQAVGAARELKGRARDLRMDVSGDRRQIAVRQDRAPSRGQGTESARASRRRRALPARHQHERRSCARGSALLVPGLSRRARR